MPQRRFTLLAFLVGFGSAVLLGGVGYWASRASTLRIDSSRPAVVHRIQQLQRLETLVYGMDKIVPGGQENRYLPNLLAGERLLLIVYGEVTAGVDLGKIEAAQVEVSGRNIRLAMPQAEIFSTRIDNERTKVYSHDTGLFTRPDPNLETEVRKAAERQIRQAALDGGILSSATASARTTLTTFLQGLGFDSIQIR
jgi:hypothetical protein